MKQLDEQFLIWGLISIAVGFGIHALTAVFSIISENVKTILIAQDIAFGFIFLGFLLVFVSAGIGFVKFK